MARDKAKYREYMKTYMARKRAAAKPDATNDKSLQPDVAKPGHIRVSCRYCWHPNHAACPERRDDGGCLQPTDAPWLTTPAAHPPTTSLPPVSTVERTAGTAALQECVDREVPTLELPEVTLRHGGPGTFDFKVTAIDKGDGTPGSSSITVEPARETPAEKQERLLALGRSKVGERIGEHVGERVGEHVGEPVAEPEADAGATSGPKRPPSDFGKWMPERRRNWLRLNWPDIPKDETADDFVAERLSELGFR